MTIEELKIKLSNNNVPERWYSLDDGLKPDAFILLKNYSKWEYFYLSEKGDRSELRLFHSDSEAYDHLLEILKDELIFFKIKPRIENERL